MKLLTKEILEKLPALYSQEKNPDPTVIVKFFHPCSAWTWWAYEYDPKEKTFFGFVRGHEDELGYFSLTELEELKVRGLGVERDRYFKPTPLSKIKSGEVR